MRYVKRESLHLNFLAFAIVLVFDDVNASFLLPYFWGVNLSAWGIMASERIWVR